MQINYLNINDIKPYENNPRKNKDAVDYVAKSIQEFGFKNPIKSQITPNGAIKVYL